MGIGPDNLGGPGKKPGVHGCGTPMKKLYTEAQKAKLVGVGGEFGAAVAKEEVETPLGKVETTGGARYKSIKDKRRKQKEKRGEEVIKTSGFTKET